MSLPSKNAIEVHGSYTKPCNQQIWEDGIVFHLEETWTLLN